MKILIASVGKQHETYIKQGVEEFTKRLQNYFTTDWLIIPSAKNAASLSVEELKKAEAAIILTQILKDDFLVLLDEKGKALSSPALADFIQKRANESTKRIVVLIGGAFGVHESIVAKANFVWSLSSLVFPHMLVRLIIAEQLYRACTILKNEKYHHI